MATKTIKNEYLTIPNSPDRHLFNPIVDSEDESWQSKKKEYWKKYNLKRKKKK